MRIAFIVGGFPMISETWILAQVTSLLDRGHEVDIYARRASGQAVVHADVTKYGLMERTRYFELPMTRRARSIRAALALARNLPRHPKAMLKCLNLWRYRSFYAVLNNVMFAEPFLDRHYDAVLYHFGGNGMDFIALKDVFPDTRFVTMFHGDDYFIGDEKGPEAFDLLKRFGDSFLVTTDHFGRATLRRYGFDDRLIATLRLSIATKAIRFRERCLAGDTLRILSVGRLVPKKGLEIGVRAVMALHAANPKLRIEYRVIGDGPLRADLTRLAKEIGAASIVHFLGALPGDDVARWMQESDIYLHPSLMEQAGYVLLEAQAAGLPVVATRVGGVPEMVREGKSALLVEAGDVQGTIDALQWLVDHPNMWPRMGREGRCHVDGHHDVNTLTVQLEEALKG